MTTGLPIETAGINTELIDLEDSCSIPSVPNYPNALEGATGVFINESVILCGGGNASVQVAVNECYKLSKDGITFNSFTSMQDKRLYFASSIINDELIWATGGLGGNSGFSLGLISNEFINPQDATTVSSGTSMPLGIYGHQITTLNSSTSILTGGGYSTDPFSKKTYYFDHNTDTWNSGPDMTQGRRWHATGIIKDSVTLTEHIVVAGGCFINPLDSVEIMFNGDNFWTAGNIDWNMQLKLLINIEFVSPFCLIISAFDE